MVSKEHVAASMLRECDICIHLFGKLPPEAYDYRPSEGQRSTLELLRYLAICGIGGIRAMSGGDWGVWKDFSARTAEMPAEGFPAMMERQKEEIAAFFAETSEETLETQPATLPWKETVPLGAALLAGPFKWLAAYKLQLFLYAKANGAEVSTPNAWMGSDQRPQ